MANYFTGQKQKTLKLITSAEVNTITQVVKMVAKAIVELESEVNKGMLPTAKVAEFVNKDLDEQYKFDSKAIGKAATSLSLQTKHMPDGKSRGIVINKEDIDTLRRLIEVW